MNHWKSFILILGCSICNTVSHGADLIISEYNEWNHAVDGLYNHYVELFNATDQEINLDNYQLWRAMNGGGWNMEGSNPRNPLQLSGTLGVGQTFVVTRENLAATPNGLSEVSDMTYDFLNISGDDAVGLAKKNDLDTFELIDVIGEPDVDPGDAWSVAGIANTTQNRIMIRKPFVCTPNTNWTAAAGTNSADSEWIVLTENYSGNVGQHNNYCAEERSEILYKEALFIGNSYTFYNEMPAIVSEIATLGGRTLYQERRTIGGYKLVQHADNADHVAAISSRNWDHVIMQEQSTNSINNFAEFDLGITNLDAELGAATSGILYMTWGRQNSTTYPYYEMQQGVTDAYETEAEKFGYELSPVGVAWKKVRDDLDPINLYDPDGTHPSYAGSYLAGCVFYAVLFDQSPVGLAAPAQLTESDALYLQQNAYEAYLEYLDKGFIDNSAPEPVVHNLPGTFLASAFNAQFGLQLEDVDPSEGTGQNLGWTDAGDYVEYEIDVALDGDHEIDFRVASDPGAGSFEVTLDGTALIDQVDIGATGGWQSWTTITDTAHLPTGRHTLRITVTGAGFNLYQIDVRALGLSTHQNYPVQPSIHVYPNPCANSVSIGESAKWMLMDATGGLIDTGFGHDIQLQQLPNGLYLVHVQNSVHKVFKQ